MVAAEQALPVMEEEQDLELLATRAARGDLAAFEALYQGTYRRIHALCLRMSGSRGGADDLTQETYVRAWRSIGAFRGESGVRTWLHRIAIHTVIDHARSQRRHELTLVGSEPLQRLTSPVGRPESAIDLERAIASLPPGARHVLVLHDIHGYRHDEIAAFLGVTVGTSKSQLSRARRLVVKEIAHD